MKAAIPVTVLSAIIFLLNRVLPVGVIRVNELIADKILPFHGNAGEADVILIR
jgi:hypothetical protein